MTQNASDPDLIKITEIFLVPSSFLVAAIGTSDSNPHRAMISILGLVVSILWWIGTRDAFREATLSTTTDKGPPRRTVILYWLPIVFIVGWVISTVVHLMLWSRPL